jgi:hypothetical protein
MLCCKKHQNITQRRRADRRFFLFGLIGNKTHSRELRGFSKFICVLHEIQVTATKYFCICHNRYAKAGHLDIVTILVRYDNFVVKSHYPLIGALHRKVLL